MSSEAGTHGAPEESIEFDYSDEDEGKKDKKDQVMSQGKQKAETKARDEKRQKFGALEDGVNIIIYICEIVRYGIGGHC